MAAGGFPVPTTLPQVSFSTLSADGLEPFRVLQEKEANRERWRSALWPIALTVTAFGLGWCAVLLNRHRNPDFPGELFLHLTIASLTWCFMSMYPSSRGPGTRPRVRIDGQRMEIIRAGSLVSGICRGLWALLCCGGLLWLIIDGHMTSAANILAAAVASALLMLFLLLLFPEIGDTVISLDGDTFTLRVGIACRFTFNIASEARAKVHTIRHLTVLRISVDPPVPSLIWGRQAFRRKFTVSEFTLSGIDLRNLARLITAQHWIRTSPDRTA